MIRTVLALATCCVLGTAQAAESAAPSSLLKAIRYAHDQAGSIGSGIWPDYAAAPFGFLVTLDDHELLLCHRRPAEGFKALPTDPVTGCDAQTRANTFPKNMLAAMPVVEGVSTIVMGTPESTGRSPADWTRTIFHEHFHQYQSSFNDYYGRLNALGLSRGDTTGMWMLNYPFPYKDDHFRKAFDTAKVALHDAVTANHATLKRKVAAYLGSRAAMEATVPQQDWKYLELELWYEGVARWTDIAISERTPDRAVRAAGTGARKDALDSLASLDPAGDERLIVYPYGAAEAMLLERCNNRWRNAYPATMSLGALVKTIDPAKCR